MEDNRIENREGLRMRFKKMECRGVKKNEENGILSERCKKLRKQRFLDIFGIMLTEVSM